MSFLDDIVKGATQVATAIATPFVAPVAAIDALTGNHLGVVKNYGALIKEGKIAPDLERNAQGAAAANEANARTGAFNDALASNDLDSKTLQELTNLYNSGADSGAIAEKINAARAGKGIYGVRKQVANESSLLSKSPGRSQISSLGSRSILGGGGV